MYKEKLRELLKEVPEIKKDLEELRFGTEVEFLFEGTEDSENGFGTKTFRYQSSNKKQIDDEIKNPSSNLINIKIGNYIKERHIRMYCENKNILLLFKNNFIEIKYKVPSFGGYLYIKTDNTKDLENQSETFYKELYEVLLELNK